MRRFIIGLGILLLLPMPARSDEILVHAAASLTDSLEEIGNAWQRATGHHAAFNFGASSDLARQLTAGAPGDVFFSADREQMDAAERAGRVRLTDTVELLSNTLVVVVPAAATSWPRTAADLLAVERIALADREAVPAGVYARQWLESLGLWEKLRGRVVPALNVRAALAAVESENAGAAVVYRTDAAIARRAKVAFEVPREQGPRIVYVVAPLASSGKAAAREFVSYLRSPAAQAVFARRGFVPLAGR